MIVTVCTLAILIILCALSSEQDKAHCAETVGHTTRVTIRTSLGWRPDRIWDNESLRGR